MTPFAAADPSSAVSLLQPSLAQQGIVTANKSAPKPTFSTLSSVSGPLRPLVLRSWCPCPERRAYLLRFFGLPYPG
jgi:hypothetical protein